MGMKLNLPSNNRKSLQKMAERMKEMQNRLADLENKKYIGSAGGNAVIATLNGKLKLEEINISSEIMDDKEAVEDLTVSAVNDALSKAIEEKEKISDSATAGLNIQGLF